MPQFGMADRVTGTQDQIKRISETGGQVVPLASDKANVHRCRSCAAICFCHERGALIGGSHLIAATSQANCVRPDATGAVEDAGIGREGIEQRPVTGQEKLARKEIILDKPMIIASKTIVLVMHDLNSILRRTIREAP